LVGNSVFYISFLTRNRRKKMGKYDDKIDILFQSTQKVDDKARPFYLIVHVLWHIANELAEINEKNKVAIKG